MCQLLNKSVHTPQVGGLLVSDALGSEVAVHFICIVIFIFGVEAADSDPAPGMNKRVVSDPHAHMYDPFGFAL